MRDQKKNITVSEKTGAPHLLKQLLWLILSGLLYTAAFPVIECWPPAWIALIPLFWILEKTSLKSSFFLGWFWGAVHSTGIAYWVFYALNTSSEAGIVTSFLFLIIAVSGFGGLYFAIFSLGANWLLHRIPPGIIRAVTISFWWIIIEYCRSSFFSGFPWGLLGHTQYRWLQLIQIADITGVYGISFLVVLGNVSWFEALKYRRQGSRSFSCLLFNAALLAVVVLYGSFRISQLENTTGRTPRPETVAVIQCSIPQNMKWKNENQNEIINRYLSVSEKALQKGASLIIWPETVLSTYLQNEVPADITGMMNKYDATLVLGGPRYTGTPGNYNFYNAAYQFYAGKIIRFYDKIHLLPFGEYFPFGFIDILQSRFSGPREYSPGSRNTLFQTRGGKFGVLICFEVIFPDRARQFVAEGADFLVTISNDAWFGKTSAHYQHFSIAVFRAVEFRRQLIRSSNTGISGFIDPTGKVIKSLMPFTEGYLTADVIRSNCQTVYYHCGDFIIALGLIWSAMVFLKFRIPKK